MKYYADPLKIPMSVSGNFGELRPNHFHTGIDFRTDQKTGLPVCSSAEGYVSRIVISPNNYGKSICVEHPNSTTTLYGHLESFREDIQAYVKAEQYKRQSYEVDLVVPPGKFKVGKQEPIAYSGNSGASRAPHLHFEIRDTETQDALNPFLLSDFGVIDKTPPKMFSIKVYPLGDESNVDLSSKKKSYPVRLAGKAYQLTNVKSISAYGEIGVAVKAFDYVDGNGSVCGIYSAQLIVNGEKIFSYHISRIPFNQNRYLNSHVDYEEFVTKNSLYQKLWRDPGNHLYIYETDRSRGILQVDSGKVYKCEIVVSDVMGNKSKLDFTITGKYARIPVVKRENENIFKYDSKNSISTDNFELNAPIGAFYEDFPFHYSATQRQPGYYSDIYKVNTNTIPIHKPVKIRMKTEGLPSSLIGKACIARVGARGDKTYAGGKISGGWAETTITQFGSYAVVCDTVPPVIVPSGAKNHVFGAVTNQIRFSISDNLSGIKSYRGMIDDEWALFEYDQKSHSLTYYIDPERLTLGKHHTLELTVTDQVGNASTYKAAFVK